MRSGGGFVEPAFDLRHVHTGSPRLALELLKADASERDVIHLSRGRDSALMFEMAGGACVDLRMKGARLALEERFVIGVADDAFVRVHSFDRRVAGRAVILQRGTVSVRM